MHWGCVGDHVRSEGRMVVSNWLLRRYRDSGVNYSLSPHVPVGPPTLWVSPRIFYLPMLVQKGSRFGLHLWLEGRGRVVGIGKEHDCRGG